jgi:hypothetical protein
MRILKIQRMRRMRKKKQHWRPERIRLKEKLLQTERKLQRLEAEWRLKFGSPWPEYNQPEAEKKEGK